MKDQLLFENTFKNRRTNGSNHAYWTKIFRSILMDDVNIFNRINVEERIKELSPMYCYLSKKYGKAVVIFQYNLDSISNENKINYKEYLTAWTSKRVIDSKATNILNIYLLPSSENIATVKKLIYAWFFNKKEVDEIIRSIYDNQRQ